MSNILLVIEQCNPDWPSVPLVGYKFFTEIDKLTTVTLVTHERNRNAISGRGHENVVYIPESRIIRGYYKIINPFVNKIWSLYHTFNYPIYAEFNRRVYAKFHQAVRNGEYDLVHVLTPMIPRYPVKLIKACRQTPFLLGPVNGGVPYPSGFQNIARKEHAYLNFLRNVGRAIIPGYKETYQKADYVLAGSTYTLNHIMKLFSLSPNKVSLFFENGVDREFIQEARESPANPDILRILFVGRLVPYKGADMLIAAIARLAPSQRQKIELTIVGNGPEWDNLRRQVKELNLENQVKFTGWVKQHETVEFYRKSDIFCFPSIREFGGAVVLEAMANGLPCIVVDHGGIGEYVTDQTGIKIAPHSRDYVIIELTKAIELLLKDRRLLDKYSAQAVERVKEFEWSNKAREV